MGVRKTESRIPSGYQATDLGESVTSSDGKLSLISFYTSPLAPQLHNTYIVFVLDPPLLANTRTFQWNINEDGTEPRTESTTIGECHYKTTNIGNLTVSVTLLDDTATQLASLLLIQRIEQLNPTTEAEIQNATEKEGAGAANPAIVRELVNGYHNYYKNLQPQIPEGDDAFQRFITGMIFRGNQKTTPEQRAAQINRIADSFEDNPESFATHTAKGVGVCDIRLALLAMVHPAGSPLIPWAELPEPSDKNALADEQLRQSFNSISENDKIDLLNLARLPKTSILLCAKLIDALRNKYFAGASFNDVITGMNGTRGHWILKHYMKGPLKT